MRRIAAALVILVAATAAQALADGKLFWREKIPPTIPYQRALILFDEGTETLILQSRYAVSEARTNSNLGWVVPVPAEPEVASMRADHTTRLFHRLSMYSPPKITSIRPIVFTCVILALLLVLVRVTLFYLASFALPPGVYRRKRHLLLCLLLVGFAGWLWLLVGYLSSLGQAGQAEGAGVDVIAEHRAGVYNVKVVRSDEAGALVDWLNTNEFEYGAEDIAAFESYVSKGWCFVVAIVDPTRKGDGHRAVSQGLAAPLILRFPHERPVYPVALTATGGFKTEILVYLASATKMSCDDRLTLRFAGEIPRSPHMQLLPYTEPQGFFDPATLDFQYLCKFKDRLTPEEMTEDIVFTEAEDETSYREHIFKW